MQQHKLTFIRGDDVSYRLFFRRPNADAVPLDGCRLDLHARTEEEPAPVITLSTDNGSIQIVGDGVVFLHFSHTDTQQAVWERADYDLQLTDPQGKRKTVLYGTIRLIPDQTRI